MKIQWQIKQHKDAKKAQNQHDEEVGKAFSFCEDHKKNQKKGLKMAGTRNRLLNKISNQLAEQNKLEKKKLKVYKEIEKEKMEEIKKSHNMNDFNFKMIMKNESQSRKKRTRSE